MTDNFSQHNHLQRLTAMGLLVTMGIVFGDIGTSPLYVMKAIMGVNPEATSDYVIGAVSCVIWTLTLQTTLKYVIIALRADNRGEGGILALYALLRKTGRHRLYIVAAIGAAALIADGVITPAITVTSAVEGLKDISSEIPVTPIVLLIITGIFMMQRAGTGRIGRMFGPFMLVWFTMLGVLGCMNIGSHADIFKAFNPVYALRLLIDYPGWFLVLGAVFLCTTGAEALYSDLGHCGRLNISVSWIFVKIMLILNYLGQGAWIISHQGTDMAGINPFYAMMPHGFTIVGVIMSTGAAIIASQALLSGSFTIFSEAVNLGLWPRMRINYPSTVKGQLYIPSVNRALFAGCIITILMFSTSSAMEAAYGLAITVTMLMTTLLLSCYLRTRGVNQWLTALFLIVFLSLETCFCVANLFKFAHGGWFTMLIAGLVAFVMLSWRKSTSIRNTFIEYRPISGYTDIIADIKSDTTIPKYASNVVYISRSPRSDMVESKVMYSIINKHPKRADHYWIVRLEHTDEPDTLEYSTETLLPDTLYCVHMRLGFRIFPRISLYLRQIIEDLVAEGRVDLRSGYPSLRKRDIAGDFSFIIIHRIFSQSSACSRSARRLMLLHGLLRHLGVSDETALGLDTSVVTVETVPLIINTHTPRRISHI